MDKRTKIVATVSDQRCDPTFLTQLFDAGVNVVRLNSAHMDKTGFDLVVDNVRTASPEIAILVDTKGAEVRTTKCEGELFLCKGDPITVKADPELPSRKECISVNYPFFVRDVPVGSRILIDDGEVALLVLDKNESELHCRVENDGTISSRKSINVPDVHLELPAVSKRDQQFMLYAIERGVAFIAHSFVRSRSDVEEVRQFLDEHGGQSFKIISKIENQEGVDNIDDIIDASYGIMIARGDLGIEIDMERIPALQQMMVHRCILKKKPVIVATQMLHTMIHSPRPTRAEVSDVSSAIMMNTDAVMLSGETAYGKYPVEAVTTMSRIIKEAERHQQNRDDIKAKKGENDIMNVTSFLAKQTVKAVCKLGVKAIITDVAQGRCARNLSAYRGEAPIYAICRDHIVARQLNLSYGIFPFYQKQKGQSRREYYVQSIQRLLQAGYIGEDDLIAYVGGTLSEELGTTSLELTRPKDILEYYNKVLDSKDICE